MRRNIGGSFYRQCDGLEIREVGDDIFLIDLRSNSIHHLNVTGAALWRMLAEPYRVRDLLALFKDAFPEKSRRILKKSLKRIIEDFTENGLLVISRG